MKKRGNFQHRFRFRNLLRQFKRELRLALWSKFIHDHIMKGRGAPAMLKGVCSGEGGMVHGPMLAMVGDDPGRKEIIIPEHDLGYIAKQGFERGSELIISYERAKRVKDNL